MFVGIRVHYAGNVHNVKTYRCRINGHTSCLSHSHAKIIYIQIFVFNFLPFIIYVYFIVHIFTVFYCMQIKCSIEPMLNAGTWGVPYHKSCVFRDAHMWRRPIRMTSLIAGSHVYHWSPGPVVSYKLRYIVGFWLVEMAISTNQKPTIYRNLYENTDPDWQTDEAERRSRCFRRWPAHEITSRFFCFLDWHASALRMLYVTIKLIRVFPAWDPYRIDMCGLHCMYNLLFRLH